MLHQVGHYETPAVRRVTSWLPRLGLRPKTRDVVPHQQLDQRPPARSSSNWAVSRWTFRTFTRARAGWRLPRRGRCRCWMSSRRARTTHSSTDASSATYTPPGRARIECGSKADCSISRFRCRRALSGGTITVADLARVFYFDARPISTEYYSQVRRGLLRDGGPSP